MGLFREADTAPPPPPDSPPTYGDLNLLSYLSNLPYNGISQHQIPGFCFCLHVEAQETVVLLGLVCLDGFVLAIRLSCSCLLYHLLRFTLVILSTFLCKKGYLWSIFTFSLLPLFFPFLLCFPSKPLCVPPPFFFFFFPDKAPFIPALSGVHLLALLSITPACSHETPVAPGPSCCVFDHSCDLQQTCTRLGERRSNARQAPRINSGGMERGRFSPPLYQNACPSAVRLHCLASMK